MTVRKLVRPRRAPRVLSPETIRRLLVWSVATTAVLRRRCPGLFE